MQLRGRQLGYDFIMPSSILQYVTDQHMLLVLQNGRAGAQKGQAEDQAKAGVPRIMRLATDELVPALNEHVRPFFCIARMQIC